MTPRDWHLCFLDITWLNVKLVIKTLPSITDDNPLINLSYVPHAPRAASVPQVPLSRPGNHVSRITPDRYFVPWRSWYMIPHIRTKFLREYSASDAILCLQNHHICSPGLVQRLSSSDTRNPGSYDHNFPSNIGLGHHSAEPESADCATHGDALFWSGGWLHQGFTNSVKPILPIDEFVIFGAFFRLGYSMI